MKFEPIYIGCYGGKRRCPRVACREGRGQGALRNSRASAASASGTWMRSMVAAE